MFNEFSNVDFLDKNFDFELDPYHFLKWLKSEGNEITGNYSNDVSGLCEHSCLYISMLLYDKDLIGDMFVYTGCFGIWDHYWIGYLYEENMYYIDLTLSQFISSAPKLSISYASNIKTGYNHLNEYYRTEIREYIDRKRGFEFYTNPKGFVKPEKWFYV